MNKTDAIDDDFGVIAVHDGLHGRYIDNEYERLRRWDEAERQKFTPFTIAPIKQTLQQWPYAILLARKNRNMWWNSEK